MVLYNVGARQIILNNKITLRHINHSFQGFLEIRTMHIPRNQSYPHTHAPTYSTIRIYAVYARRTTIAFLPARRTLAALFEVMVGMVLGTPLRSENMP